MPTSLCVRCVHCCLINNRKWNLWIIGIEAPKTGFQVTVHFTCQLGFLCCKRAAGFPKACPAFVFGLSAVAILAGLWVPLGDFNQMLSNVLIMLSPLSCACLPIIYLLIPTIAEFLSSFTELKSYLYILTSDTWFSDVFPVCGLPPHFLKWCL